MLGKSSSTGFQLCRVTSAKVSAFVEHAIIIASYEVQIARERHKT